jgi:hypothetical protein
MSNMGGMWGKLYLPGQVLSILVYWVYYFNADGSAAAHHGGSHGSAALTTGRIRRWFGCGSPPFGCGSGRRGGTQISHVLKT